MHLHIPDAD